ncbi:MAG: FxLYD domain-containing protein [bacterium]|nr:FxLYD domain-containing protein [bacterium]
MFGKQVVKDYQPSREELVLDLVKKYPLYSLDKLLKELPGISRHSLQLLLEKNNLSTIEKRLAFAAQHPESFIPKERLAAIFNRVPSRFKLFGLGLIAAFALWQIGSFLAVKPPTITLDLPVVGFTNSGEKVYVSGRVSPAASKVKVNNQMVLLNGDGSFTAIVPIPVGESILDVEAVNWGKKAKIVRLVNRELTQAEIAAKQEEEAAKKKEAAEKMAGIDKTVNDLLAARNANTEKKNVVKVLNSQVQEEAGFSNVAGEVVNQGEQEVGWVMITVTFLDQAGGVVDKKFGFATEFGQVLKPNQSAKFETQATTKTFDHYSLEVSWSEGAMANVAGTATKSAEER